MKARFCEKTNDLHLDLSLEDIILLEGNEGYLQMLTAKNKIYNFWLRKYDFEKNGESNPIDGFDIHSPPPERPRDAWIISITEEAYQRLRKRGEIGTRTTLSSKIKLFFNPDLKSY